MRRPPNRTDPRRVHDGNSLSGGVLPKAPRERQLRFRPGYRERSTLANGTQVCLRLLERDDSALLVHIFERLSPRARYQRFFAHKNALSAHEIQALTDCDGVKQLAIVAVIDASQGVEEAIGVARLNRVHEDPITAEIALAVVDAHQRSGVGHLLLHRLLGAACVRGVQRVHCFILADNTAMLALLRQVAPGALPTSSALFGTEVSAFVIALPLQV